MKKLFLTAVAVLTISLAGNRLFAQATTSGSGDLLTTLTANQDYLAFSILLRSANLGTTLKGTGPFTVFAPNNAAFNNISSAKLDSLMADPGKLTAALKGHIVSGRYDKAAIIKTLGSGTPTLKTIDGQTLTLSVNEKKNLQISDSQGNKAVVIAFDIIATNGVVIGVNDVLAK